MFRHDLKEFRRDLKAFRCDLRDMEIRTTTWTPRKTCRTLKYVSNSEPPHPQNHYKLRTSVDPSQIEKVLTWTGGVYEQFLANPRWSYQMLANLERSLERLNIENEKDWISEYLEYDQYGRMRLGQKFMKFRNEMTQL